MSGRIVLRIGCLLAVTALFGVSAYGPPNEALGFGGMAACGALIGLTAVIIAVSVGEVQKWRQKASIISKRQFVIRIVGSTLSILLLVRVFIGAIYVRPGLVEDIRFVEYWMQCLGLALLVCIVAIVDFYYVMRCRSLHRSALSVMGHGITSSSESKGNTTVEEPEVLGETE
jgi:hypothetical protein